MRVTTTTLSNEILGIVKENNTLLKELVKAQAKPATKAVSTKAKKPAKKTSAKAKSNDFDYDEYLATAKKLAKQGKVTLRKNGAPVKADRPKVYKAMGL